MTKKGCLWLVLAILAAAISPLAYAGGRPVIQTVSVQLSVSSGYDLHPLIEEKVRESIGTVANRVLIGQDVSLMQKSQKEIGGVVKTVFNTVLRGYAVQDVKMVVGEKTLILLELHPTSLLVEKVELNLQLPGVSDKMVQVINGEVADFSQRAESMLLGIPVEAFVWAEDLIKPALLQWIRFALPGFVPTLELNLGPVIRADLTLAPEAPLVKDIQVHLETQSLPRLLVGPLEARLESELALFDGLPVRFLEKYQDRIMEEAEQTLQAQGLGKHIYLSRKPKLELGTTTHLDLDAEWIDYRIEMSGEVSIGMNAPSPAFHLSLGKRLGERTVFAVEDVFSLRRPTGTVRFRLERQLSGLFTAQIAYNIHDAEWRGILDWRHNRYGITVSKPVSRRLDDARTSFHYALTAHSQVSLVYEKKNLWMTLQQTF